MQLFDKLENIEAAANFWCELNADSAKWVLLLPLSSGDCRLAEKIKSLFLSKLNSHKGIVVEGENAKSLLTLFSLYSFTDKLIIGSFDQPHGRKLRNLLDCGIATEDELINDVILGAMKGLNYGTAG